MLVAVLFENLLSEQFHSGVTALRAAEFERLLERVPEIADDRHERGHGSYQSHDRQT